MTRVGEILTRDLQNGVTVGVGGNSVTLAVLRDGKPFQNIAFSHDQALELAGYLKIGADILARQGGSGLGDARHFDPVLAGNIILPGATLGQMIPIGHVFFDGGWRDAVSTMIRGNELVFRIIKNLVKQYEIAFSIHRCEEIAEFFHRAAIKVSRAGT